MDRDFLYIFWQLKYKTQQSVMSGNRLGQEKSPCLRLLPFCSPLPVCPCPLLHFFQPLSASSFHINLPTPFLSSMFFLHHFWTHCPRNEDKSSDQKEASPCNYSNATEFRISGFKSQPFLMSNTALRLDFTLVR